RPFVIGGLFVPQEYTDLAWEEGTPGQASVSIQLWQVKTTPERLRATRPCSDLWLGWHWFSTEDRAGEPKATGSADLLGNRIPVADGPASKPAATLVVGPKDDRLVDVIETRGTKTRIIFSGDSALVVGWVPSSALRSTNAGGSRDYFPSSTG